MLTNRMTAWVREERRMKWLVCVYLVCLGFLSRFDIFRFAVIRILSPAVALYAVYKYFNRPSRLPTEAYLFLMFLFWTLGGVVVAKNMDKFWEYYLLTAQVGVLFLMLSFLVARYATFDQVMLSVLLRGALYSVASIFTGDLQKSVASTAMDEPTRVATLSNANAFGFVLMLGSMAAIYFLGKTRKWMVRAILAGTLVVFSVGIIYSASRKAYVTLVAFVVIYTAYYMRTKFRSMIGISMALVVAGVLLFYASDYMITNSFLGARFKELQKVDALTYNNNRYWLYLDGIKMLQHNPIMGVGLGQFEVYSFDRGYAHSDYMEVAATTGIVGSLIYFPIYFVLLRRVWRSRRVIKDPDRNYEMHFILASVICLMMIAFGRPSFFDLPTMTLIGAFAGHSFRLFPGQPLGGPLKAATMNGRMPQSRSSPANPASTSP